MDGAKLIKKMVIGFNSNKSNLSIGINPNWLDLKRFGNWLLCVYENCSEKLGSRVKANWKS